MGADQPGDAHGLLQKIQILPLEVLHQRRHAGLGIVHAHDDAGDLGKPRRLRRPEPPLPGDELIPGDGAADGEGLEGVFYGTEKTDSQTGLKRKVFEISQRELMFGRLMRFEGLTCHYAGVPNQDGVTNPALKSGSFDNIYPSWLYSDPRPTVSKGWYHWAFKEEVTGKSLYGSVLFTYNPDATVCSANGVYALRTSGYSRFARRNVCKDGEKATITAIYGIYAQKSDYKGNADDYASYQLTISSFSDMEFENGDDAFLTDEQVAAMTTEDMKTVPWIDEEEGESEDF